MRINEMLAMSDRPNIYTGAVCVTHDPVFAAVISSYFQKRGEYFVVLQMSKQMEAPNNIVGKMHINFIDAHVNNRLRELRPKKVILGGLNDFQKSIIRIPEGAKVEVADLGSIHDTLVDFAEPSSGFLSCRPDDIVNALWAASNGNLRLVIDPKANDVEPPSVSSDGVFVLEEGDDIPIICSVNLACASGADIKHVSVSVERDVYALKLSIENAGNGVDGSGNLVERSKMEKIKKDIVAKISAIDFKPYSWATFLTNGTPYSLVLNKSLPTSLLYRSSASLGIYDSLYKEQNNKRCFSSLIFSVPVGELDDESMRVARLLDAKRYFVTLLKGKIASVRNFGMFLQYFYYDILHISSHGGGLQGYFHSVTLTDEDNLPHVFDYYQVVSFDLEEFPSDKGEPLVGITGMLVPNTLDAIPFRSEKHSKVAVRAVEKYITGSSLDERKSDFMIPFKGRVPYSRSVQCIDGIHQGQFQFLSCQTAPFVFNNTCCSWFDLGTYFLGIGSSSYVGTLWNIDNKVAKDSAELFYDLCLNSDTSLMTSTFVMNQKIMNVLYGDCYVYWGLPWAKIKGTPDPMALTLLRLVKYMERFLDSFRATDTHGERAIGQDQRNRIEDFLKQTIIALPKIYWDRFSD